MMSVDEARTIIDELKGRYDAPFGFSDKRKIEKLYYEVLGKTFVPTSCQTCYHDALIEIYSYLKKYGKMAEKTNYRLKAGAIINCPTFKSGKVYSNDNLTDEVAKEFLAKFPKQKVLFQTIPAEVKATKKKVAKKAIAPKTYEVPEEENAEGILSDETTEEGTETTEGVEETTEETTTEGEEGTDTDVEENAE